MGRIISDVSSKRTLIVEGGDEVERIRRTNRDNECIFEVHALDNNTYKVELIYRVGDYTDLKRGDFIVCNKK